MQKDFKKFKKKKNSEKKHLKKEEKIFEEKKNKNGKISESEFSKILQKFKKLLKSQKSKKNNLFYFPKKIKTEINSKHGHISIKNENIIFKPKSKNFEILIKNSSEKKFFLQLKKKNFSSDLYEEKKIPLKIKKYFDFLKKVILVIKENTLFLQKSDLIGKFKIMSNFPFFKCIGFFFKNNVTINFSIGDDKIFVKLKEKTFFLDFFELKVCKIPDIEECVLHALEVFYKLIVGFY